MHPREPLDVLAPRALRVLTKEARGLVPSAGNLAQVHQRLHRSERALVGDGGVWRAERLLSGQGQRRDRALAELDAIGPPPHTTPEQLMTRVRWVTEFGGIHVGRGFGRLAAALAWRLFTSGFYSPAQAVRALRELPRTQARALAGLAGLRMPSRLDVPLTVLQGRLDVAAPPSVMLPWFESLEAPQGKSLVWLEHCAHTPHFEAPLAFRAALGAALALEASRSDPAESLGSA